MIKEEFENIGHAPARGVLHCVVARTPATSQTAAVPVSSDVDAETELGAVVVLGYN